MVVTSKDVTEADVQAMLAAGNVTVVEEDRKIIDMGTVTEATRVTTSDDGKTVTEEKTVIKREGDGGVKILEESKTTKPRSRSKSSSSSSSSSTSASASFYDSVGALSSMSSGKSSLRDSPLLLIS